MRTMVDIDDDILRQATRSAEERGHSLGELVTQSLRDLLTTRKHSPTESFVMPVFGVGGNAVKRPILLLASLRDEGC